MPTRNIGAAVALLSNLGAAAVPGRADVRGSYPSVDRRYQAALAVLEGEPELADGRVTSLTVRLLPGSAASAVGPATVGPPAPAVRASALTFAATMPEHGHQAPLRPAVIQAGPDEFLVRGVKLSMAGRWELRLEATLADGPVVFLVNTERD